MNEQNDYIKVDREVLMRVVETMHHFYDLSRSGLAPEEIEINEITDNYLDDMKALDNLL